MWYVPYRASFLRSSSDSLVSIKPMNKASIRVAWDVYTTINHVDDGMHPEERRKYVTSYVVFCPYDLHVVHIQSVGILVDCIMFIAIDVVRSYTCIVNWRQRRLRNKRRDRVYGVCCRSIYGPRLFHIVRMTSNPIKSVKPIRIRRVLVSFFECLICNNQP